MKKCYLWSAVLALTFFTHAAAAQVVFKNCAPNVHNVEDESDNFPDFYNNPLFSDALTGKSDLSESPFDFALEVESACPIASASFTLKMDLDGDDVAETIVDSDNLQAAGIVLFDNLNGAGTPVAFDTRNIPPARLYQFAIQYDTLSSGNITLRMAWNERSNYVPCELPYGLHEVVLTVTNTCGDTNTCGYGVRVYDTKPPTIVCKNGVSINLINSNPPMVQLWASDVLDYVQDNHSPMGLIKVGTCLDNPNAINADLCSGSFPLNPDGTADTMITFDCRHLGTTTMQLWAIDTYGNQSSCEAIVSVEDALGTCGGGGTSNAELCVFAKSICVPASETVIIPDVEVKILGSHPTFPPTQTFFTGCFSGSLPIAGDYSFEPQKNTIPTEGVNAFDLLAIQKHLLGNASFSSPYRLIAADANKSGSITPTDIIELRKLILGIYPQGLPSNTSWRFVDASYIFPYPNNPFTSAIPEMVNLSTSFGDTAWFYGIKIGDTDCSYIPKINSNPSNIQYTNKRLNSGREQWVQLRSNDLLALQGTLEFDNAEVLAVKPHTNCTAADFYLNKNENAVTFVWFDSGDMVFDVKIKTKKNGSLSEMLRLSDRITERLAMNKDGTITSVALLAASKHNEVVRGSRPPESIGEKVQSNKKSYPKVSVVRGTYPEKKQTVPAISATALPSVFSDKTKIHIEIADYSKGKSIELRVFDTLGNLVHEDSSCKGASCTIDILSNQVPTAGLYFVHVNVGSESQIIRIVKQ